MPREQLLWLLVTGSCRVREQHVMTSGCELGPAVQHVLLHFTALVNSLFGAAPHTATKHTSSTAATAKRRMVPAAR
jgi:hypothetical protein